MRRSIIWHYGGLVLVSAAVVALLPASGREHQLSARFSAPAIPACCRRIDQPFYESLRQGTAWLARKHEQTQGTGFASKASLRDDGGAFTRPALVQKEITQTPRLILEYTAAYEATGKTRFAEAVIEMTDWLCGQQYVVLDVKHPDWLGGFRTTADEGPSIGSAVDAEALEAACRVARRTGDRSRLRCYRTALTRCLRFVVTLQYTPSQTRRFADWYRPRLLGSFCVSPKDETPAVVGTQHAVAALARYLDSALTR
jgi:hypothetical protein